MDGDGDTDVLSASWYNGKIAWYENESMAYCEGDLNGDGLVDPLDSGFILARFGCAAGEGDDDCDRADVNADGVVDPLDVGFILARFGDCEG